VIFVRPIVCKYNYSVLFSSDLPSNRQKCTPRAKQYNPPSDSQKCAWRAKQLKICNSNDSMLFSSNPPSDHQNAFGGQNSQKYANLIILCYLRLPRLQIDKNATKGKLCKSTQNIMMLCCIRSVFPNIANNVSEYKTVKI
jgi:hypothetical protein